MKKKKILLLSDDLRMHSGIATQSKEFVMGTLHKYDWVQIGGAVKHPEEGKVLDMSQAISNDYGITDAYLKIYPISARYEESKTSIFFLLKFCILIRGFNIVIEPLFFLLYIFLISDVEDFLYI